MQGSICKNHKSTFPSSLSISECFEGAAKISQIFSYAD
jgi:hypothetical protein